MCRYFAVSGRVQGVYYRASTRETARQLGLTGWVRNLPDGRVEGIACGSAAALADFERWLHQGPPHADVSKVVFNESPSEHHDEFTIRY